MESSQMMGKCKLCLQDGRELQQSHYLPAGVYRILRDNQEKNPHPWLLTPRATLQTSKQLTAPLFCGECEQRLSRNGEDWVLKNCLKPDGRFPLAAALLTRKPDLSSSQTSTKIYFASKVAEINVSALCYFAASIFWRGSIYDWNSSSPVTLGPFEESFRVYLMGLAGFPKECSLWLAVREGKEVDRITYPPAGSRTGSFHTYRFPMPGFAFLLLVGKGVPENYRDFCFATGAGNPIVMTAILEDALLQDAAKLFQRAKSHRG